jgi:hypothetical protein
MTAKNCLQILMDNDAPGSAVGTPAPSRQPDDALDPELIDELDLKPGEVDLCLLTRWRFKTHFETCRPGRSLFAHAIAYDALAASEAAFLNSRRSRIGGESGIGS